MGPPATPPSTSRGPTGDAVHHRPGIRTATNTAKSLHLAALVVSGAAVLLSDRVAPVTDRVASVTDRVVPVADRVRSATDRVVSVTDRVASVTDRVASQTDRVEPEAGRARPLCYPTTPARHRMGSAGSFPASAMGAVAGSADTAEDVPHRFGWTPARARPPPESSGYLASPALSRWECLH
jgi:hypothetical protein